MIPEDDKRLTFIPMEELIDPPNGLIQCWKNYWWMIHPTKGLVFWNTRGHLSAQCNLDQRMMERFKTEMYPWADAILIPQVFKRININDYQ